MSLEKELKESLKELIEKSVKSKEIINSIVIGENNNKPKQEKLNYELDTVLLENNINAKMNDINEIFKKHKVEGEFKNNKLCYKNNFLSKEEIVNNLYNCLFKEYIENNSPKGNKKYILMLLVLLILVGLTYKGYKTFIKKN